MKKVAFYTLGCKLNFSETSTLARLMEQQGYERVEFNQQPDIFIINTCSVTDNADKKCRKIVREAQKINPDGYVAILGCYAQLKPQEIAEIPGVDAVLGAAEKFRLHELMPTFEKVPTGQPAQVFNSPIEHAIDYHASYSLNDRTRTFLKVQDGCDYPCAYCTIPLARGKSRSDTVANVVAAAREIAARGRSAGAVKEIVLTGVNIGDFGLINGERQETFFDLIRALDDVQGIERFRISSIEPNLLTDEIIAFVAQSKRFVPHFHVPLQSGSNKVLSLMRRRYKRELYAERVAKIKELMPHACIGVDVIVGHPGETNELFLETYQFLNELPVSYLHVFTYSERANTTALTIKPVVPGNVRADRSKMLHILSDKKRRAFYESQVGRDAVVLFEEDIQDGERRTGLMQGFTENYVRVVAKYDPLLINETLPVHLSAVNADGLMEVEELHPTPTPPR
ncbi:tRNA (N(6)-L-threonylcarbamoyladenosine(37)-C(2))-methylthiotransferase MtaB [Spirosoma montaniterrae]|uniref:tRNA (N(6)-L-threonylcarbamoyladenosine(37)-C(2))-methylthiotransferase MtaB n=1 Tax=Spirosoma montaniterrae TaxID=1178516 RepID=A0A1P9X4C6_9BACT|nr:tRNA (N(6)-L-threonylcarbamoyladenosine(37)-C(2))-methylthiotransferase MtaB [Spirosoma montaniterrae]